jgi:hypothetical protein
VTATRNSFDHGVPAPAAQLPLSVHPSACGAADWPPTVWLTGNLLVTVTALGMVKVNVSARVAGQLAAATARSKTIR